MSTGLPAEKTSFALAWRSLARQPWLAYGLLGIGTFSNLLYAHTPLVAFAVAGGVALWRQRAIAVVFMLWAINQGIGFGLRGYPFTATALTWGVLMGVGALLTVMLASWRPSFGRTTWLGHWLWLAIAFLVGFGLYQGLILLAMPLLANGHTMDWRIVMQLWTKDLLWTGAIAIVHGALLLRQQRRLPASSIG